MCAYDYDESCIPEFFNEIQRKAKKEHKCGECRRTISPKEKYISISGKWDGEVNTHKICSHCEIATKLLMRECGGYLFNQVRDDLQEHIGYNYPWERDARRLVAGMRKKWIFNGKLLNIPQLKTIGVK